MSHLKLKAVSLAAVPFLILTSCDQGHGASKIAIRAQIIKVQDVGIGLEIRSLDGRIYCISKYDLDNISENYQIFDENGAKIEIPNQGYLGAYEIGSQNLVGGVLVISERPLNYLVRLRGFSEKYDEIQKISYRLDYFECNQIGRELIATEAYVGSVAKTPATGF